MKFLFIINASLASQGNCIFKLHFHSRVINGGVRGAEAPRTPPLSFVLREFTIKIEALAQMLELENSITSSFEHLDVVVETFDGATGIPIDEIVAVYGLNGLDQTHEGCRIS